MPHGQSSDSDGRTGGMDINRHNMIRPLIFLDRFSGEEDFSEWIAHFNSVSVVNGWSDDEKYMWLNVHVTGKACVSLARLQRHVVQLMYLQAIDWLRLRFDPPEKKQLSKIDLQHRLKQEGESWGDFGDAISVLVDRVYPDLEEKAKDMYRSANCISSETTSTNYSFRGCASYD